MIDLLASAEVENVARIGVPSDHTFFLKLQCTTCRSDFPNAVGVSSDMVVEGIRGDVRILGSPCCAARHPATRKSSRRNSSSTSSRRLGCPFFHISDVFDTWRVPM